MFVILMVFSTFVRLLATSSRRSVPLQFGSSCISRHSIWVVHRSFVADTLLDVHLKILVGDLKVQDIDDEIRYQK